MRKLLNLFFILCFVSACMHDPCKEQSCNNGGICNKGLCECPKGWGGSDCSEEQTPSKMYITKIVLLHFTGTKPGGLSWDSLDGADITLTFKRNGTSSFLYQSQTIQNADSNTSYEFVPIQPINIIEPQKDYLIYVDDEDVVAAKYELIAIKKYTPYVKGEKFPNKVTSDLSWGNATARVEIYYDYEW